MREPARAATPSRRTPHERATTHLTPATDARPGRPLRDGLSVIRAGVARLLAMFPPERQVLVPGPAPQKFKFRAGSDTPRRPGPLLGSLIGPTSGISRPPEVPPDPGTAGFQRGRSAGAPLGSWRAAGTIRAGSLTLRPSFSSTKDMSDDSLRYCLERISLFVGAFRRAQSRPEVSSRRPR